MEVLLRYYSRGNEMGFSEAPDVVFLPALSIQVPTPTAKSSWNPLLTLFLGILIFIFSFPIGATGLYSVAGFMILIGLALMFVGYVQNGSRKKKLRRQMMQPYPQQIIIQAPAAPAQYHSEVTTREIVKVRCKSCNSLNFETANRCVHCGASL